MIAVQRPQIHAAAEPLVEHHERRVRPQIEVVVVEPIADLQRRLRARDVLVQTERERMAQARAREPFGLAVRTVVVRRLADIVRTAGLRAVFDVHRIPRRLERAALQRHPVARRRRDRVEPIRRRRRHDIERERDLMRPRRIPLADPELPDRLQHEHVLGARPGRRPRLRLESTAALVEQREAQEQLLDRRPRALLRGRWARVHRARHQSMRRRGTPRACARRGAAFEQPQPPPAGSASPPAAPSRAVHSLRFDRDSSRSSTSCIVGSARYSRTATTSPYRIERPIARIRVTARERDASRVPCGRRYFAPRARVCRSSRADRRPRRHRARCRRCDRRTS